MSDMQMAVGVGGAVMQGKGRAGAGICGGFLAQAVINADLLPMGQPFRLALGQACAHWKIGSGKA